MHASELAQLRKNERHLFNLLARIHRDGGQYTDKHGIDKAVTDADVFVAKLIGCVNETASISIGVDQENTASNLGYIRSLAQRILSR